MKTLTIPQKQSNTGSIHDLASEHFARDIRFCGAARYAVVRAAYYGGKGYRTACTEQAACNLARTYGKGYSYEIMDSAGAIYAADHDRLIPIA